MTCLRKTAMVHKRKSHLSVASRVLKQGGQKQDHHPSLINRCSTPGGQARSGRLSLRGNKTHNTNDSGRGRLGDRPGTYRCGPGPLQGIISGQATFCPSNRSPGHVGGADFTTPAQALALLPTPSRQLPRGSQHHHRTADFFLARN